MHPVVLTAKKVAAEANLVPFCHAKLAVVTTSRKRQVASGARLVIGWHNGATPGDET